MTILLCHERPLDRDSKHAASRFFLPYSTNSAINLCKVDSKLRPGGISFSFGVQHKFLQLRSTQWISVVRRSPLGNLTFSETVRGGMLRRRSPSGRRYSTGRGILVGLSSTRVIPMPTIGIASLLYPSFGTVSGET